MRLLLDTHVFLWYITADPKLPATFRAAIQDPANDVYLSTASVWEAVIKHALNKLPVPELPAEYPAAAAGGAGDRQPPGRRGADDPPGGPPAVPPGPFRSNAGRTGV